MRKDNPTVTSKYWNLWYWLAVTSAIYYPIRAGFIIYQNPLPPEDVLTIGIMAFFSCILALKWAGEFLKASTPKD